MLFSKGQGCEIATHKIGNSKFGCHLVPSSPQDLPLPSAHALTTSRVTSEGWRVRALTFNLFGFPRNLNPIAGARRAEEFKF